MERNATYHTLLTIQREIAEYSKNSLSFALFNEEKIKRFKKCNDLQLQIANGEVRELFDACVKKDDKGNYIVIQQEGKEETYEFYSPEDEKIFNEKVQRFNGAPL